MELFKLMFFLPLHGIPLLAPCMPMHRTFGVLVHMPLAFKTTHLSGAFPRFCAQIIQFIPQIVLDVRIQT